MTAAARLEGIEACVFDAYGTLFDVHSAVGRHRARIGEVADSVSATWRSKQLQYTWLRSLMHRWTPFSEVTADALDFALDEAGIEDDALRRDLLDAYRSLECYPEVAGVLDSLRGGGMRTAILSNGSREMLDAAVASAGDRDPPRRGSVGGRRPGLQAAPGRLPPRVRPARGGARGGLLSVLERVGRGGGGDLRLPGGLGEPLRPGRGSDSPTPPTSRSRPSTRFRVSCSASAGSVRRLREGQE